MTGAAQKQTRQISPKDQRIMDFLTFCDQQGEEINSKRVIVVLTSISHDIDAIIEIANEKKSPHIKFVGRSIERILFCEKDGSSLKNFILEEKTLKTISKENEISFSSFEKNRINKILRSIQDNCHVILEEENHAFFYRKIENINTLASMFMTIEVERFHKQKREIFQFLESDICAET